eukprot:6213878-Pleurochrysis_carterae.AAC.2
MDLNSFAYPYTWLTCLDIQNDPLSTIQVACITVYWNMIYKHMTKQKLDNKAFNNVSAIKDYVRTLANRILTKIKNSYYTLSLDSMDTTTHKQSQFIHGKHTPNYGTIQYTFRLLPTQQKHRRNTRLKARINPLLDFPQLEPAGREGSGERQASPYWSPSWSTSAPLDSPRTRSRARAAATPRRLPGSGARLSTPPVVCRCQRRTVSNAVLVSVRQPPNSS